MDLVFCERFKTKMTAAACERFKANTPDRCKGCSGPVDKELCAKCGKPRRIVSRSLCAACRKAEMAAGTIDLNFPKKSRKKPVASAADKGSAGDQRGGAPQKRTNKMVTLTFEGEDIALYEDLVQGAKEERRGIEQEILVRLCRHRRVLEAMR